MSLVIIFQRQHKERRPLGDYSATVKVTTSPTSLRTLAEYEVKGHRYDDGWPVLLAKFLMAHHPEALLTAKDRS
jgi:hypothetical protein